MDERYLLIQAEIVDEMMAIYVRQVIEEGLADSEAGRVLEVREIRKKYGLQEAVA